jgi:uncharacterized lipoprotein YmbA
MTHRIARLSLAALGLLCACSILDPRADPTRFFVLSPSAQAGAEGAADPAAAIAVGPVRMPDYLLRPELVRRVGPNQLEPSRVDRWAEPIDRALLRVLCLDLAALLPRSTVIPYPAPAGEKPALQIELELSAFEADRAGAARLQARWEVRDRKGRTVHGCSLEREAGSGETPAMVAALSELLADLSRSIAAELGAGAAPADR